ncbi:MAG: hypothetical protein CVV44_03875 [Spirochaetae bacterium HGW-Spirochaetae-1]|jgi:hypothetical protein|nr:MAG: hypothetical protein CVV44_03875 [Spirochaetae bacterium HGW-Spirochaetae-1]
MDIITRESNRVQAESKLRAGEVFFKHADLCGVSAPVGASKLGQPGTEEVAIFAKMERAAKMKGAMPNFEDLKRYGSAFDIPVMCHSLKKKMSIREMVAKGVFSPQGSTNTLLPDWESLWDAVRIDLSIKKAVNPTIRENIYRIIDMPNSDKVFKVEEFFPYAVEFKEHNGSGEAVNQGETRGGQVDTVEHFIYAAGFTHDLLAALFDKSLDFDKVNDAVMEGYNSLRDDLAISKILAGSYTGTKTTAAATTSGATREELLYYTLENAIDVFAKKTDPVTGQKIGSSGLVCLASEYTANHIARVANGIIKKAAVSTDTGFPSLSAIRKIIGYDGNTITGRTRQKVYSGVGDTYAYLVMPCTGATKNRYMNIGIKRNLTAEIDLKPDVKTLSQAERAWYFAEGIMYSEGINSFIQRVTLPAW